MNSIDIANGIVFQRMNIKKDTFDERIICQKKIYLLEMLGTNMGYSYNWYLRGPYSPSLANYVYSNLDILLDTDFRDYKISEVVENNINLINGLQEVIPNGFSTSSWFELLASLVYIDKNRGSWKIADGKDSLFSELRKYKSQYSIEQCNQAYNALEKCGLTYEEK